MIRLSPGVRAAAVMPLNAIINCAVHFDEFVNLSLFKKGCVSASVRASAAVRRLAAAAVAAGACVCFVMCVMYCDVLCMCMCYVCAVDFLCADCTALMSRWSREMRNSRWHCRTVTSATRRDLSPQQAR